MIPTLHLFFTRPLKSAVIWLAGLRTSSSRTPLTGADVTANAQPDAASPDMQKAATQIAQRCLRRWDGPLGIRAGTDSGGARAGIWRRKYDGVRCAVLLLAFHKLNQDLQTRPNSPGGTHFVAIVSRLQNCRYNHSRSGSITVILTMKGFCYWIFESSESDTVLQCFTLSSGADMLKCSHDADTMLSRQLAGSTPYSIQQFTHVLVLPVLQYSCWLFFISLA